MSRIYIVKTTAISLPKREELARPESLTTSRLVRADNPAQARNFVTRDSISVRYAEQDELALLVSEGVSVEDATDPNNQQPTLPVV